MKNIRVARRYATALMAAAESAKGLESVTRDLAMMETLIRSSRELRQFLDSPVIPTEKKHAVFQEILGAHVGTLTMEFIRLLTSRGRESILPDVIEQFGVLHDDRLGIVNVDVTSAVTVSKDQETSLTGRLEAYTKKRVRMRFTLDKAIRGGLIVRIGDTVLDASVRRQLELLKERFVHGGSANN